MASVASAMTDAARRSLTERLKAQAYAVGFDLAGVVALGEPATRAEFDAWLAAGLHGEMHYLDDAGAALRRDTRLPHAGATHALVVAINYGGREPSGPVARYARGDDYHELLRAKLRDVHAWLEREVGHAVNARPYVDSGPVLERDLAQRAGLGWFGKNSMLISPKRGSFLFLASLFVDVELDVDVPFDADRCGTCTRCLDACPTQAFVGPRVLDAKRCISYLTIELRGEIPVEFREAVGDLLYGCDICQEVCPWNHTFSKPSTEPAFAAKPHIDGVDSLQLSRWLLGLSREEYASAFRGSPMKRAKRAGLVRNAAVVLGNVGSSDDVEVLSAALADEEPLVRSHVAWALGSIGTAGALAALRARLPFEDDGRVRSELVAALARSVP